MNQHSQGSIYGTVAMIHFLDTKEGKAIAEKNLGVIGIKGIAITALGYGKLDRRMKALKTGAQLYYMRNIGDWVSFIAAQGMPTKMDINMIMQDIIILIMNQMEVCIKEK